MADTVHLRKDMVVAIESCALQILDGNKGKSNVRTSLLHGAVEKYINARMRINWDHEKTIKSKNQSFNIDVYATGKQKDVALLLKAPLRSMAKNKKNSLVNTWGEAIRVSLIRKSEKKTLSVLSISIYPTTDIVISQKNTHGGGITTFKPYKSDPPQIYNDGFSMLSPSSTQFRYVAIPYEFTVPHTLKRLDRVLAAFKAQESGTRISIKNETWNEFDKSIDWMLTGFNGNI